VADSLIDDTDRSLEAFQDDPDALLPSAGDTIADDVILDAGHLGYETGEREELCSYIDATLTESGIDVAALDARNGFQRWELGDRWRTW
jgi:hypothetical protein